MRNAECDKLQRHLNRVADERDEARAALEKAEEEVRVGLLQLQTFAEQADEQKSRADRLDVYSKQADAEIEKLKAEVERREEDLTEASLDYTELHAKLKEARAEIERMKSDRHVEVNGFQDLLEAKGKEIERLKAEIERLTGVVAGREAMLRDEDAGSETLRQMLDEAQAAQKATEAEVERLRTDLATEEEERRNDLNEKVEEIGRLKALVDVRTTANTWARDELHKTNQTMQELRDLLDTKQEHLDGANHRANEAEQTIATLEDQIQRIDEIAYGNQNVTVGRILTICRERARTAQEECKDAS